MKESDTWYLLDEVYLMTRRTSRDNVWKQRAYGSYAAHCRELPQEPTTGRGRPRRVLVINEAGVRDLLERAGVREEPKPYPIPYRLAPGMLKYRVKPGYYNATMLLNDHPRMKMRSTDYGALPRERVIELLQENNMYSLLEPNFLPLE